MTEEYLGRSIVERTAEFGSALAARIMTTHGVDDLPRPARALCRQFAG
jgi:hypothetical protein